MINLEDIRKNYPYPPGFDRSALREYFQYKILDILFKNGLSKKISFLGGTAIKICYGSRRYSEDLDFDNFGLTERDFADMSEAIKRGLSLEGYEVETKNILKTVFRCYIKSPLANEKITVQIDTMAHDFDDVVYLMGLTDFNYAYLKTKLGIENKDQLKNVLLEVAGELNLVALVADVSPFLINQEETSYISGFKEYIGQKM